MQFSPRGRIVGLALVLAASMSALGGGTVHGATVAAGAAAESLGVKRNGSSGDKRDLRFADDSLRGKSGKLLARLVVPTTQSMAGRTCSTLFGDSSLSHPGIYAVADSDVTRPLSFIAMHPFGAKQGDRLGAYRIGYWPGERRAVSAAYANPVGFIEVTRENRDTRVSEHFRLSDFLTHDQANVWPKYLVVREELIDKLELVITELERAGHPVRRMTVMSGFRTPQYNAGGGNTSGRATMSRHMYGDASDVFVDNDGDGRMDDLNGDGRVDYRDAQIILDASARVEAAHPELIGGGGVYRATAEHGPFAHIDVRGKPARWGLVQ